MKNIPKITEKIISERANSSSFQKGYEYYRNGAVESIEMRGNQIFAEVEGSEYEPYKVFIELGHSGIEDAECSCPYDYGGDCKHIVAVLLTCIYSHEDIVEKPEIEDLIKDLNREQLYDLVLDIADQYPDVFDLIEDFIQDIKTDAIKPLYVVHRNRSQEDIKKIEQDDTEEDEGDYRHYGEDNPDELLEKIENLIETGKIHNAITLLEGVTEENVDHWKEIDWDEEVDTDFLELLGKLWAEVVLTPELTPSKREELEVMLETWYEELSDYDVEGNFQIALEAIKQGWDYPHLVNVLRGEITNSGAWEGEVPWFADDLAIIRLKILARQGRYQEYIYLAEAEGQLGLCASMMVQLGKTKEALDFGLQYINLADEMLILSRALYEKNEIDLALQAAENLLKSSGGHEELARWTRDIAIEAEQPDKALDAITILIKKAPTLNDYKLAQKLAGDKWQSLRDSLLDTLREENIWYSPKKIEILLYEELVDDAIKALGRDFSYESARRVLDAAITKRPDWVSETCQSHAELIMEAARADMYEEALRWLKKAKEVYATSNQKSEWNKYINSLLDKNKKKHKLIPMLKNLLD